MLLFLCVDVVEKILQKFFENILKGDFIFVFSSCVLALFKKVHIDITLAQ